jgi:hypothetical protein
VGGVIFFVILIVWFVVSLKLARILVNSLIPKRARPFVLSVFSLLVFITPVADEIIGGFQFGALCSQERKILYNEESIKNRTLLFSSIEKESVPSFFVPITKKVTNWSDPETDTVSLQRIEFLAKGGWLSRLVAFNAVTRPFTFNGVCSTKEEFEELRRKLKFSTVYN